ncbi:MAG: hypothetical protein AAFV53_31745 [Myxococcota bacterium]
MANLDSSVPHYWSGGGTLVLEDGSGNSITVTFMQGTFSWSETGRDYTEAMERERHASVPVLIETGDGNVTGQFSFLITSFKGNSNVHPYEALTFSGNASGWTSTSSGTKKSLRARLTVDSTQAGGGLQQALFNHLVPTSVDPDLAGANGLAQGTVNWTDHENQPQYV